MKRMFLRNLPTPMNLNQVTNLERALRIALARELIEFRSAGPGASCSPCPVRVPRDEEPKAPAVTKCDERASAGNRLSWQTFTDN